MHDKMFRSITKSYGNVNRDNESKNMNFLKIKDTTSSIFIAQFTEILMFCFTEYAFPYEIS